MCVPVVAPRMRGVRRRPWRAHRAVKDFLGKCLGGRTGGTDYYELSAWRH